jgi:hypothetical protein
MRAMSAAINPRPARAPMDAPIMSFFEGPEATAGVGVGVGVAVTTTVIAIRDEKEVEVEEAILVSKCLYFNGVRVLLAITF